MNELERIITEKVSQIIPYYEKLDIRANVSDRSFSIEFFVTIDGVRQQCYDMVDNGLIKEHDLDMLVKSIVQYIRSSSIYMDGQINKISFTVVR